MPAPQPAMTMSDAKPPTTVRYAVEIGVVFLAVGLLGRPLRGPADAVLRVVNTLLGGAILYGIYRMRRWAVWSYLLLTFVSIGTGAAMFGLAAWRGLIAGGVLRVALLVPSMFYWRRLT
jgi:hypothetical protein